MNKSEDQTEFNNPKFSLSRLLLPVLLTLNQFNCQLVSEAKPAEQKESQAEKQIAQNYSQFLSDLRKSKSVKSVGLIIDKNSYCSGIKFISEDKKQKVAFAEHCIIYSKLKATNYPSAIARISKPITSVYENSGSVTESLLVADLEKNKGRIKVVNNEKQSPKGVGKGFKSKSVPIDPKHPVCENFDVKNPIVNEFNGLRNRGMNVYLDTLFLRRDKKSNSSIALSGNSGGFALNKSPNDKSKYCILGSLSSVGNELDSKNYRGETVYQILRTVNKGVFIQNLVQVRP